MPILSRTQISKMDEKQLRQEVIIPLLQAMGFNGVFEWHGGPAELGKDVVAWRHDVLGDRKNLVVVAKATRLSKNPELQDVAAQVTQAFNTAFEDRETNSSQRAHECWIISNKGLSKETTRRIWATLPQDKTQWVRVIGEHELWEHVKRHLTVTLEGALGDIQDELSQLDSKLPIRVLVTKQERRIEFLPPENPTDAEESLHFSARFQFDNDEQGRARIEEIQALFETGAPVTVPGSNFLLTLPEDVSKTIEKVTGVRDFNFETVSISPISSTAVFPVRIEVSTPDGRNASLPSIDLRIARAGSSQVTFDNGLQQYPIFVELTHRQDGDNGSLRVTQKNTRIAAPLLANFVEFMELFGEAGATTTIRAIESDLLVMESRRIEDAGYPFDPEWVAIVRDLARIQNRTNVPI